MTFAENTVELMSLNYLTHQIPRHVIKIKGGDEVRLVLEVCVSCCRSHIVAFDTREGNSILLAVRCAGVKGVGGSVRSLPGPLGSPEPWSFPGFLVTSLVPTSLQMLQ